MAVNQQDRIGFKFTKIGWIPEDWECVELSTACISGGDYGAPASSIDFLPSLPRYIRITDISEDGRLLDDDLRSIPNDISSEFFLKKGDFLFARSGASVGKTYLHKKEGRFVFAGYLIRFNPNPEILVGDYLKYFTHSHLYKVWKITTTRTGAQPNINSNEYSKLLLPIPKVAEQKEIVQILSTWDRTIESLEKLIEAKQRLKRGLMQQLLTGKMRFPEFGKPIIDNELPKGWDCKRMYDVGNYYNGLSGKSKEDFGKGKPYITYLNIFQNYFVDKNKVDFVEIKNDEHQSQVKKGDILFTLSSETINEVGISSVLLEDMGECYLNSFCMGFRLFKGVLNSKYAAFLFRGRKFRKKILKCSQGSTRYNLSKNGFLKIEIDFPNIDEQIKIVNLLVSINQSISTLQREKEMVSFQKQGLMKKLLSGEVRVKNEESV